MMRRAYAIAVEPPLIPSARSCGAARKVHPLNERVARAAREVFTLKTAMHISAITGYSPRACEYWLSGGVAIPGDALASLLRSEYGRHVLAAIMEGATPSWWRAVLSIFSVFDALRAKASIKRTLEAALNADDDLQAAIAQSEAAVSVLGTNYVGARAHVRCEVRSASNRALAPGARWRDRR